jgi:hypothetical protein
MLKKMMEILLELNLEPEIDGNEYGWTGYDHQQPHRRLFIRLDGNRFKIETRTFSVDRPVHAIVQDFQRNGFTQWIERCDNQFASKTSQSCNEQKLLDRAIEIGLAMGLTIDDVTAWARRDKGYRVELHNYETNVKATVYQDRVDVTAECHTLDTATHMIRTATYAAQQYKRKAG